jgi:hypothetical protein
MMDFAIGHIARGVTLQFANFVPHLSSALFRNILLVFRVTQFTFVLHAGFLVSCRTFMNFL